MPSIFNISLTFFMNQNYVKISRHHDICKFKKTEQYMQLLKDDKNANILLDAYRKMPPDQAKAFVDFAVETVKRYKDDE